MKKTIIIALIFISNMAFSQEKQENNYPPPTSGAERKVVAEDTNSVDKMAEFPGGISNFRKQFSDKFDVKKVKGIGVLRSEALFDINTDGTIDNIKTSGLNSSFNNEIIEAVKRIKTKWAPAERNGKKVKYKYRIPITMMFE